MLKLEYFYFQTSGKIKKTYEEPENHSDLILLSYINKMELVVTAWDIEKC